jgi:hypothetical protein
MSTNAEHQRPAGGEDLITLEELIRRTPGAHPISTVDELRGDAFETDEELDEFLAFVTASRTIAPEWIPSHSRCSNRTPRP